MQLFQLIRTFSWFCRCLQEHGFKLKMSRLVSDLSSLCDVGAPNQSTPEAISHHLRRQAALQGGTVAADDARLAAGDRRLHCDPSAVLVAVAQMITDEDSEAAGASPHAESTRSLHVVVAACVLACEWTPSCVQLQDRCIHTHSRSMLQESRGALGPIDRESVKGCGLVP